MNTTIKMAIATAPITSADPGSELYPNGRGFALSSGRVAWSPR